MNTQEHLLAVVVAILVGSIVLWTLCITVMYLEDWIERRRLAKERKNQAIKVWLFNELDFVAGPDLKGAQTWYQHYTGVPVTEILECDLGTCREQEHPINESTYFLSFRTMIIRREQNQYPFPCILCSLEQ